MLLHTVQVWEFLPQTLWILRGYLEDGSLSTCHAFIFFLPQMWAIAYFLQEGDFKNKKDLEAQKPHSAGKFLALCCVPLSSFSSAVSREVPQKLPEVVSANIWVGFSWPSAWSACHCRIGSPLALQPAWCSKMMKSLVTLPQQTNIPLRKCSCQTGNNVLCCFLKALHPWCANSHLSCWAFWFLSGTGVLSYHLGPQ